MRLRSPSVGAEMFVDASFYATQYIQRGLFYQKQNRFEEALAEHEIALQLTPNDKYARWNRALSLLALGRYEEGFKEHEVAWTLFDWHGFGPVRDDMVRIKHLPIWNGEDIEQDKILVYHELGFGDGIQTLRYLPDLRQRAGAVTLVINTELVRLAQQFEDIEVVDRVPADVSKFSYRLPMFGVMRALKQNRDNIPKRPYIEPKNWSAKTGKLIGVCWSGRTQTEFTGEFFLSKLAHAGYELHSLQLGPTPEGIYPLSSRDFADTVELMAAMDHIVTIDSAPAHLAGAMGHPFTHLLLPVVMDWRWHFTEVWYPRIKTYRQTVAGDWDAQFQKLNEALRGN